jgi:DNA-binding MarR family transcriptional regulator
MQKPQRKSNSSHSRRQEVVVSVLRTAQYLRGFCSELFDQHGITPQQYNVLRILRGGPDGLPTGDIADRMIEPTPGITRLLDRLEAKKLARRERPSDNRRQVLCYITRTGLGLLNELEEPLQERAVNALQGLKASDLDELVRLLELVRNGTNPFVADP